MKTITEAILKRNTNILDDLTEKVRICLDRPDSLDKVEIARPDILQLHFQRNTFGSGKTITIDFDEWEDMGLSKKCMIRGGEGLHDRQFIIPFSKNK